MNEYHGGVTGRALYHRTGSTRKIDPYSFLSIFAVLISCIQGVHPSNVFGIVLSCLLLLFIVKPTYLFGPLLFFTVYDDYILAFEGISFSRICVVVIIVGSLLKFIVNRTAILRSTFSRDIVALAFASLMFSLFPLFSYVSIPIVFLLNTTLCFCMANLYISNIDKLLRQLYSCAAITVLYYVYLVAFNDSQFLYGARLSISASVNVNQVALGLSQTVIILFASSLLKQVKHSIASYLLCLIALIGIFLTGSRTSLLASLLSVFLIWCLSIKSQSKSNVTGAALKSIVIFLLVLVILYAAFMYLSSEVPTIARRFTYTDIINYGGGGRFGIWSAVVNEVLPNHYLFGIGFDNRNVYYAVQAAIGSGHHTHNIILELIVRTGIVGLAAFIGFLCRVFKAFFHRLKGSSSMIFPISLLACNLLISLGEDGIESRLLWFSIGLGIMLISSTRPKDDDKQKCQETKNGL